MRENVALGLDLQNPPRSKPLPEWGHIHAELRRRGVTLALLWEEYRGLHPDGYGYSRFCDLYVEWRHGITATMRQTHAAGEKLFVAFAGDTVPVFDGLTGEVRAAKIFVAVLGHQTTPLPKLASARSAGAKVAICCAPISPAKTRP